MSNVMEMYEQQMDMVSKAAKLEKVSGTSIDVLIQYYTYMNNVLKPLADKFERVNIMTPEEIVAAIEERPIKAEEKTLSYPYPLTIIEDRYSGVYSHGIFTAWNRYADCVPDEIDGGDITAYDFWNEYRDEYDMITHSADIVGLGNTPEEAVKDLMRRIKEKGL